MKKQPRDLLRSKPLVPLAADQLAHATGGRGNNNPNNQAKG